MIPDVIHQIWFQGQNQLSDAHRRFQDTVRKHHPGWTLKLWDSASIAELLENDYPQFTELYESYPLMIQKVDAAKYFIMHRWGGVYVDTDMESRKPLTPLLDHDFVFTELHLNTLDIWMMSFGRVRKKPFINNGFMASVPQHPFWEHLIGNLEHYRRKKWFYKHEYYVSRSTGPQFFTLMVQRYRFSNEDRVLIAPPEYFEPDTVPEPDRARHNAYIIHHQDNSWLTPLSRVLKYVRYKLLGS